MFYDTKISFFVSTLDCFHFIQKDKKKLLNMFMINYTIKLTTFMFKVLYSFFFQYNMYLHTFYWRDDTFFSLV